MSIGLLLVTHSHIGAALLATAVRTVGTCPLEVEMLSVSEASDPQALLEKAQRTLEGLDQGAGVLVLTDIYGSTPSNIACRLLKNQHRVRVVAGINLPMLIRVFNYSHLSLAELQTKALSGGKDGVLSCT